jgi:hypothetical protein
MYISNLNWGCFLKGKKPKHSTDHSLISEAKVKNVWNFTVTSLHGTVLRQRTILLLSVIVVILHV